MILADTSAWVEYLRATGSPTHHFLRELISDERSVSVTELIVSELLAGATDDGRTVELRHLMSRFDLVPLRGLADFEEAAVLYRCCRRAGETVRALSDCLIAAVAMRVGARVLHHDQAFDVIARHTSLQASRGLAPA